jgi:hypothetical protein
LSLVISLAQMCLMSCARLTIMLARRYDSTNLLSRAQVHRAGWPRVRDGVGGHRVRQGGPRVVRLGAPPSTRGPHCSNLTPIFIGMHRNAPLSPMKRVPGHTIPIFPMHLAPMAPMHNYYRANSSTAFTRGPRWPRSLGSLQAVFLCFIVYPLIFYYTAYTIIRQRSTKMLRSWELPSGAHRGGDGHPRPADAVMATREVKFTGLTRNSQVDPAV